ncbi:MAG TPA: dTMP kinase [Pseudonocardiaceae bacterium]
MGRLIVIEGLDGAGKRTLADGLEKAWGDRRLTRLAFPRYGASHAADLVRDALYDRVGDLSRSVYGMAALYALDRAGARAELLAALHDSDVVLLDRYVASNAAYGAARLHQDADGEFVRWVHDLEVGRHRLPRPHAHVLLRVPRELAADRALRRAEEDADRMRDTFESDDALQARTSAVYDGLAGDGWLAPWHVLDGSAEVDHEALAARLLA